MTKLLTHPAHPIFGLVLLLGAIVVLPIRPGARGTRAEGLALLLIGATVLPSVGLLGRQTVKYAKQDQHEVAPSGPPSRHPGRRLPESFVRASRRALAPGDTWALVSPVPGLPGKELLVGYGLCRDSRLFFWMAFRLDPIIADCDKPRVLLLWNLPPRRLERLLTDATVVTATPDYVIARRR